jgi:hypothetical protein
MGIATSPRGRARQAQRVDDEILRTIARDLQPDSLTSSELDLDHHPVTRPARAEPVTAWVRYAGQAVLVDAELVGWTSTAAAIRWVVPRRGVARCWVWRGAVSPRVEQRPVSS